MCPDSEALFVRSDERATLTLSLYRAHPVGDGVIGNTAGSGPVVGGSSPPPRTKKASLVRHKRRPLSK